MALSRTLFLSAIALVAGCSNAAPNVADNPEASFGLTPSQFEAQQSQEAAAESALPMAGMPAAPPAPEPAAEIPVAPTPPVEEPAPEMVTEEPAEEPVPEIVEPPPLFPLPIFEEEEEEEDDD